MNDTGPTDSRCIQLPIIPYEPRTLRGEVLAPRGSIVVYLAASGSKSLGAIRARAQGAGGPEGVYKHSERHDPEGHLVSLTFHGKVLAEKVPVPRSGDVVRLILPFAGGDIDSSALLVRPEGGAEAVEAVAIRHDPPLSTIEKAALSLLPRDMLSAQIGVALPGGLALNNDEERRRQAEEQRRAQEEARAERAQQQAEAQAEAAEARHEQREAARQGGTHFDIHLLDATVKTVSSLQTATSMIAIRRNLLLDQMPNG
jgi:hypothetical protein